MMYAMEQTQAWLGVNARTPLRFSISCIDHHRREPAHLRRGLDWQLSLSGVALHHQQLCQQRQGHEGKREHAVLNVSTLTL